MTRHSIHRLCKNVIFQKKSEIQFGPVPIYMCYDMHPTSKTFERFIFCCLVFMRVVIDVKIIQMMDFWQEWQFLLSEFSLTLSRFPVQQAGNDNSHGWFCCANSGLCVPWRRYVTFAKKYWTTKCQHRVYAVQKLRPLWEPDIEREHSLC